MAGPHDAQPLRAVRFWARFVEVETRVERLVDVAYGFDSRPWLDELDGLTVEVVLPADADRAIFYLRDIIGMRGHERLELLTVNDDAFPWVSMGCPETSPRG